MKVLVDADFLVALAKEDDSNHQKAVLKAQKLKEAAVFITPFTIPESVTVVSYKVSHIAAKSLLEELRKKNFSEVVLDQEIIREADKIFASQTKKGISWIDCVNVAVVKNYKMDGIVSFDAFYKKCGVALL